MAGGDSGALADSVHGVLAHPRAGCGGQRDDQDLVRLTRLALVASHRNDLAIGHTAGGGDAVPGEDCQRVRKAALGHGAITVTHWHEELK